MEKTDAPAGSADLDRFVEEVLALVRTQENPLRATLGLLEATGFMLRTICVTNPAREPQMLDWIDRLRLFVASCHGPVQ